jgi:hypothetical protein
VILFLLPLLLLGVVALGHTIRLNQMMLEEVQAVVVLVLHI